MKEFVLGKAWILVAEVAIDNRCPTNFTKIGVLQIGVLQIGVFSKIGVVQILQKEKQILVKPLKISFQEVLSQVWSVEVLVKTYFWEQI